MKIKNKFYVFFLTLILGFLGYHIFKFYSYKGFIDDIKKTSSVHFLEDFLSSYFVFRAELPSRNQTIKFIESDMPYIGKYGYRVSSNFTKNLITVYSFGINKIDDSLKNKAYFSENYNYSINQYLKGIDEDLILTSFEIEKGCNSTDLNTLNFFDKKDRFIENETVVSQIKKKLQQIGLSFSGANENNSFQRTLLFKLNENKITCLCDSGVKSNIINLLEEKLISFFQNEIDFDVEKGVFTINLKLSESDITDKRKDEIFKIL